MLVCRMLDDPDIWTEQQALQILLLSSPATRVAATELILPHIQAFVRSLIAAESSVAVEEMSVVEKQLQLVLEALADTQDAVMCKEIWTSLTPVDEAGEKGF